MGSPLSNQRSADLRVVLEIELPALYTDDLDDLREYRGEHESESDWLMNCIGEPGPSCRVRVEISGEKEGSVQEVWGLVRGARLVEPSPGVDEEFLQRNGFKLLNDGDGCEWCEFSHHGEPEGG